MIEQTEINIPPDFQSTLDDNEKLIWADKPTFVPYVLSTIWHNLLFLLFGAYFIYVTTLGQHGPNSPGIMFIIVPLIMFGFGGYGMVSALFSYSNTIYAFSQKRIIIRTGFIGINYITLDYDKIQDTSVTVNIFEKMYNVGTVRFSDGARTDKGALIFKEFVAIKNPYEVFKELKQTTVNVKTDYEYPNALRPDKNPGYNTKYDPE